MKKKKATKKKSKAVAAKDDAPVDERARFRRRIKELRWVRASELLAHPFNWREHPPDQRDGVLGMLREVGWIDAGIARETSDGLELIDGHLRSSLDPDEKVPVLIVDLTDEEANLAIATLDKLTEQATSNDAILSELMALIDAEEADVRRLLHEIETDLERSSDRGDEEVRHGPHDVEMQLRPHEHFDYLIVLARTTHQWHHLLDKLGIEQRPANSERRVGCGRAIDAEKLIALLESRQEG